MNLPSLASIHHFSAMAVVAAFGLVISVRPALGANEVLFIGNSFTIGSTASVPVIFDRLAIAGGHDDPVTVMRAVGGQDYQFHAGDATTQASIGSRQWTHVVLQNYSTEPTHLVTSGHSIANHFTYGTQLYNQVIANRADTQVVLFETWSRAAKHALITGTSNANGYASTAEMQSELRANYRELASQLTAAHPADRPVLVAPVGDAWENAGGLRAESDPGFADLHGGDDYHGNDNGYFLTAAVIYSTIYGVSPEGLHKHSAITSLGLNLTEDPAFLEQIAWDTVHGASPVAITMHPASQTVNENQAVTFTTTVVGTPPFTFQWNRDDQPINGANSSSHTIPVVPLALNGARFTVTVRNVTSFFTSDAARLTVLNDVAPPTLAAAKSTDGATITLTFSEPVAAAAASDPGHFLVAYRGEKVAVLSATRSPDGASVTLTVAASLTGNFAVSVDPGVTDLSGNALAADALIFGSAPDTESAPVLIDFGASTTTTSADDPARTWNNVTTIGSTDTGRIASLLSSDGGGTGISLQMIRRFNAANSNGTTAASLFPASATRDTLYGNTETFGSLSNVFPAFRLTGLNPSLSYTLTFYASRTGVSDNRETVYTVTGAVTRAATLNASNNVGNTAVITGLYPSAAGELAIGLAPSAANNNANHFTYLGVLALSTKSDASDGPTLFTPVRLQGKAILDWTGAGQLEFTDHLDEPWTALPASLVPPFAETIPAGSNRFYRLRYPVE